MIACGLLKLEIDSIIYLDFQAFKRIDLGDFLIGIWTMVMVCIL